MPTRFENAVRLSDPVESARFVDASRAAALSRLGVLTVGDLVRHYPARYLDLTDVRSLGDVRHGADVTVVGTVHEIKLKKPRPRLTVTEVALVDGTGVLIGVWFNQPWVAQKFAVGERLAFSGRAEIDYGFRRIKAPFVEKLDAEDGSVTARVLPVHHATEGLSVGWLRRLVAASIDDVAHLPDPLPARVRVGEGLVPLSSALRDIHFPDTMDAARAARRRLAFDELLMLQLYMALRRHSVTQTVPGVRHVIDGPVLTALREALPFPLTDDQRRSVGEVLDDMASPAVMNRMLLGDVGTGKTAVAAHALAAVADSGTQAAMMAPTEVLAEQYSRHVGPLLDAAGVRWALLTGSTPAPVRREILAALEAGEIVVLFGTHALLEQSVVFRRLSLAVVDEQHRFGVGQRLGLRSKGEACDLLVMSATPIPRSLALTFYGDLATSYLRQRPTSAPPTVTRWVKPHQADPAHDSVRRAVAEGRQAYVVCALVDESDNVRAKAATREAERLRNLVFGDLRVGLLTGRMPSSEKAEVMSAFRDGSIDVLVSTTVIEVGVDVPNATVMIIEDADRFGLSQLHQLRGRVGRGAHAGEVWLVADPVTPDGKARLEAMVSTGDGFELAELDLRLRGEGQLFGDRQHGMPELRIASLLEDGEIVTSTRAHAAAIVEADPELRDPRHALLRDELARVYASAWEWVSSG